ncbi:type II toxin-antitoxin system RelE/ParE family toxin [Rhodocyclaceae bacterium SMB388]
MDEIEGLIERVSRTPLQFPLTHRDIRKAVVRRFPYCLYFRVRNDDIVILAVFHTAQSPSVWMRRN